MAARERRTLTGGQGFLMRGREGRVSGYVLKLIRESIGRTQEGLSERIGVDTTTLQAWESGRRPLMSIPAGNYFSLRLRLLRLGAKPQLLLLLDSGLDADRFLADILAVELKDVSAAEHPLASWVITRSFTEMIAWALAGQAPTAIADVTNTFPRRGPVATAPTLAVDEKIHVFANLKRSAELTDRQSPGDTLLRRQAHYVASFDLSEDTTQWLAEMQREEQRLLGSQTRWSPSWAVARSEAHSLARKGDRESLQTFITTAIRDDTCEAANLNYWAYWIEEISEPQLDDTFMVTLRPDSWTGTRLFRHLVGKLYPDNSYIDITIHTLWALLQYRPGVLQDTPTMVPILLEKAEAVLDNAAASDQARRELEAVRYGIRVSGK